MIGALIKGSEILSKSEAKSEEIFEACDLLSPKNPKGFDKSYLKFKDMSAQTYLIGNDVNNSDDLEKFRELIKNYSDLASAREKELRNRINIEKKKFESIDSNDISFIKSKSFGYFKIFCEFVKNDANISNIKKDVKNNISKNNQTLCIDILNRYYRFSILNRLFTLDNNTGVGGSISAIGALALILLMYAVGFIIAIALTVVIVYFAYTFLYAVYKLFHDGIKYGDWNPRILYEVPIFPVLYLFGYFD